MSGVQPPTSLGTAEGIGGATPDERGVRNLKKYKEYKRASAIRLPRPPLSLCKNN
jgi:hypothetical protein